MKKMTSILITVIGILLAAGGLYFLKVSIQPQGIMKTLPYLFVGIGCGMFGHGMGTVFNELSIRKNPELAKQIKIDQKDERNKMVSNMSKARGYDIMTYVFAALMLAYALMGASMEIIIPFVAAYLFVEFYTIYARMKIEKEI